MTALVISEVGGLFPAVTARDLPNGAAQKAENILARSPDFRPLAIDATVATAPSGTQTLYRFARKSDGTFNSDPTTGWVTSTSYINYVKGQLDDNAKERTYYTYNDGTVAPGAIDVTGANRVLGVPAPAKPTGVLTVIDEFTPEERIAGIEEVAVASEDALSDNQTQAYLGIVSPGLSTSGFANRTVFDPSVPNSAEVLRAIRIESSASVPIGKILNTYSSLPTDQAAWVVDPRLGGYIQTAPSSLTWAGSASHVCIPFTAYAKGFTFNSGAASTALAALKVPGKPDTALFTSAQITEVMTYVDSQVSPTGDRLKPKYEAVKAKFDEVTALFNGDASSVSKEEVKSFYTTVANSKITSEVSVIAEQIWNIANTVATTQPYTPPSGDGSGGGAG